MLGSTLLLDFIMINIFISEYVLHFLVLGSARKCGSRDWEIYKNFSSVVCGNIYFFKTPTLLRYNYKVLWPDSVGIFILYLGIMQCVTWITLMRIQTQYLKM